MDTKMKSVLGSVLVIGIVAAMMTAGTQSWYSDTETSVGNTFTAGTLDLNIDGGNTNTVKFTVSNMAPGNQPRGTWNLMNVGTINGYLDLENITVTSYENGCLEPEREAGDATYGNPGEGNGELQDVVYVTLFVDRDNSGWYSTGDYKFYDGKVGDLPSHFGINETLNAGQSVHIVAIFNWWSTANDNLAQSDGFTLELTFELAQTKAQ